MKTYQFNSKLWLPRKRKEIFSFFTDACNLEEITPSWLQFRVVSPTPIRMQVGTEIDYRLRIRGIPIRWRSRITVWDPPYRFVDEQVLGPYRMWVHEHLFTEIGGHTRCEDHVEYAVFGGSLVNYFFVKRDIRSIFAYRSERLQEFFQKLPTEEYHEIRRLKLRAKSIPAQSLPSALEKMIH